MRRIARDKHLDGVSSNGLEGRSGPDRLIHPRRPADSARAPLRRSRPARPFTFRRLPVLIALSLALGLLTTAAHAKITRFTAELSRKEVAVGEPVTLTLLLQADSYIASRWPAAPDFGDLRVVSGPIQEQRQSIVNGQLTVSFVTRYTLIATEPGPHTIGAVEYNYAGQTYRTNPVTLTVTEQPRNEELPAELEEENILHPYSTEPSINEQLRGRLFVRAEVSKRDPYVGEPVKLSYDLYQDRMPRLLDIEMVKPEFESMLVIPTYEARSIERGIAATVGGQTYEVTPLYELMVTPMRSGESVLEGFELRFDLPVSGGRRSQTLFDSFLQNTVQVVAAGAPVSLAVQPLPDVPSGTPFSGTVGDFDLNAEIDREQLDQNDLLTLTLTIEGTGNVELAAVPEFPDSPDFEQFDTLQDSTREVRNGRLWGRKTIEYLLRPKRSGALEVPPIEYAIFDPEREQYRTLTTSPFRVQVAATAGGTRTVAVDREGQPLPEIDAELNYIKPVFDLNRTTPLPLAENPFYWGSQLLALAAVGGLFIRVRRRTTLSPAEQRRRGVWSAFDKRVREVRRLESQGNPFEAAHTLEAALRHFVADWFDISPGGMTVPEVGQRLRDAGVNPENARQIEAILNACMQVRYAPPGAGAAEFSTLAEDARKLLEEDLR